LAAKPGRKKSIPPRVVLTVPTEIKRRRMGKEKGKKGWEGKNVSRLVREKESKYDWWADWAGRWLSRRQQRPKGQTIKRLGASNGLRAIEET